MKTFVFNISKGFMETVLRSLSRGRFRCTIQYNKDVVLTVICSQNNVVRIRKWSYLRQDFYFCLLILVFPRWVGELCHFPYEGLWEFNVYLQTVHSVLQNSIIRSEWRLEVRWLSRIVGSETKLGLWGFRRLELYLSYRRRFSLREEKELW